MHWMFARAQERAKEFGIQVCRVDSGGVVAHVLNAGREAGPKSTLQQSAGSI